jgi:hypothetical protein
VQQQETKQGRIRAVLRAKQRKPEFGKNQAQTKAENKRGLY